jgi:hypothetical protein
MAALRVLLEGFCCPELGVNDEMVEVSRSGMVNILRDAFSREYDLPESSNYAVL